MSFSTRTMQVADWKKIANFRPTEFRHPEHLGYEFVLWLDKLRTRVGMPMVVTSDYRTPEHNAEVGGASDSAHTDSPCNSVDIGERPRADDPNWNRTRYAIVAAAIDMGCTRIGTYSDGSLHLDMTDDKRPSRRMWRVVGSVSK